MIYFVGPLIAFAATVLWVFVLRPLAPQLGLLDIPNERSSHEQPTPLIGGLAIFLGLICGTLAAVANGILPLDRYTLSLFGGGLLLVAVGVVDDARDLSPGVRFVAQIIASLIMIYGGGVVLTDLGRMLPSGGMLYLDWFAVPFTIFATLGVINALNMCDGLDGLSGTLALISLTGLMIVAFVAGGPADSVLLAMLAVSIVAYLLFNFRLPGRRRALIFMGDAGSMFLGYVLTWFTISLSQGENRAMVPAAALWFLMLPIFDTVSMMLRRLMRGRSPFRADREHIHHVFLLAGFTVNETVAVMAAAALIGVGMGLMSMDMRLPEFSIAGLFLICGILYFWMVIRSWKVMRFIERSICRRRSSSDRRSGVDRRQRSDPAYQGPERRSGSERRQRLRREADRSRLYMPPEPGRKDDAPTGSEATASSKPVTRA
ncbi:MAG: undecaprenyl/decaprenyl-phosphate alpha-N-acetylglucosaminyl 1-phosphate transferase [Gammaproteobacteria bacterium]|nr:MAG: undecaprenyl/decaprenyl-phosphate alpha-N-acetylglucosaminyl 1-phosphate transferase [Gammaproteobacteria bacterium]